MSGDDRTGRSALRLRMTPFSLKLTNYEQVRLRRDLCQPVKTL